ncbi:GHKL domain-containing protein [Flavobacteriaceae bacterium Ap0902]|nr:GHKL domain-containing protein [Flavobacteriaceae bacterium Ap0902]
MNLLNKLSLRFRIFTALIIMILMTAVTVALLTFFHFQETTKEFHEDRLASKEKTIIETIDYETTDYHEEINHNNIKNVLESRIFEYADINDVHISLYGLDGKLLLTSEAKLTPERKEVPEVIMQNITPNNDRFEVRKTEGDKTLLTSYRLIYNLNQQPIGIISIPYKHDDSFLQEALIDLLERLSGVIIIVLALGALVSWWISKSITSRLQEIAFKFENTHIAQKNKPIKYKYNDEVSVIVDSYNEMVNKINEQSEQLLQVEREETWREAARQVAHELKNPLTPMRLQMQSFQMRFDPEAPDIKEKVNELSKGIIRQIDTLSDIAEAFTDYTKMPVRRDKTIELITEIDIALELFDEDSLTFKAPKEPIYINFDPNYLVRIITNLVKNANQAIPIGRTPKIEIELEKNESHVNILVKDNGSGVPDEIVDKLFVPKFSTKSSGSGLGLPMVKKIVEEYDGTIRFRNNQGDGSTFIITLPFNIHTQ